MKLFQNGIAAQLKLMFYATTHICIILLFVIFHINISFSEQEPFNQHSIEDNVHIGRLDLRIGKILSVEKHPDADSLYVEKVDLGNGDIRTMVSGLAKYYKEEELNGRLSVFFCNIKASRMRGTVSEGMIMVAISGDKVEILEPPENSVAGDIVTVDGYKRDPVFMFNPKKKKYVQLLSHLKTNELKIATYKNVSLAVANKGFITAPTLANAKIE